jgi:hypothetical protein
LSGRAFFVWRPGHLQKEDKRREKQKKTEKPRKTATKAIKMIENDIERVMKARRSTNKHVSMNEQRR